MKFVTSFITLIFDGFDFHNIDLIRANEFTRLIICPAPQSPKLP